MAKYYGRIGFVETEETTPGVWESKVTERKYYGEIMRNSRRRDTASSINNDLTISNEISILADPYALNHFYSMQYIEFQGALWKVTNVEVQRPRLILTLGGLYNGEQA